MQIGDGHIADARSDHHWKQKPATIDELKAALQTVWEELPQEHINKAVANFTKCLTACVVASGRDFDSVTLKRYEGGFKLC